MVTFGPFPAETELCSFLEAIIARDRGSFRLFYERTRGKFFGLALMLLRDGDAAEDALQEAYVRIWRKADKFDAARGAAGSWLATIVRHAALDRRRLDRAPMEDLSAHEDVVVFMPSESERSDAARCIGALPPQQRSVVLLSYLHGYTADEIAEQLKKPVGTVKSWLRRSAARLRLCLLAYGRKSSPGAD